MKEKFYFSNVVSEDWSVDNNQMNMILIPKRWWSITDWKLSRRFMKCFHIIGMTEIKNENL